jgi:drug/metabolite transporter (DMT)-like permease
MSLSSSSGATSAEPARSISRRRRGIIEITLSGICFGFLGIFGKLAYRNDLTIGELLTLRFALAAIILASVLAAFSPQRLRVSLRQLVICAGLGILGYAIFASFYFRALEGTSVALASLLLYTYPVIVVLGSRFLLNESLSRGQLIALPASGIGLMLLLSQGSFDHSYDPWAIAAGLASALCYAAYILVSSRLQKTIDPLTSGLYVILFAALGLFIIHQPNLGRALSFDLLRVSLVLGIALICTVLPLVLFLSGLQRLSNTEASLLSTVEPLTASLAGIVILGEELTINETVGGLLILTALIATSLGSGHYQKSPALTKEP